MDDGAKRVLWWRDAGSDVEVPRGHGIGWASADGSHHGRVTLTSEYLRLDSAQIEVLLASRLGESQYEQLSEATPDVAPGVLLYAAGHTLAELDLADHFGADCVVGIAVELRGRGIAARVAVQSHLAHAPRDAALSWALTQIEDFLPLSKQSSL